MRVRKHAIVIVLVMVLAAGLAALLLPPLRETRGIAPSDSASFAASQRLFAAALVGARNWQKDAAALGLEPRRDEPQLPGVLLAEPQGECFGRGSYLLREAGGLPLALTAPHRGSDRHTGTLAAALYLETGAAAATWNSAPRRASQTCPAALDLAREPLHPFTAFALAFAERFPTGRVVQLHGFDGARRQGLAASEAAVIVSDGTDRPSEALLDLADCLSLALAPRAVLVYPFETRELGALSNAQGQTLRAAGFDGFVHLEMSAALRAELVADAGLRGRLGDCLARGLA